jgi:hypothetical protein
MMEPTPLRPDDQVAGGFLVLRLGGQDFEVKVLPMALSRRWLSDAKSAVAKMKGTAEGLESFEDVADFIAGQSEAMMDLLLSYDALGNKALPKREWIDTHATDTECYEGWKRVTAATSPLAREVLRIVPDLMPVLIDAFRQAVSKGTAAAVIAMSSSKPTSGSPRSTESEAPQTSKPASPTSSLPSTRRKPRSGVSKRRSQNSTAS